MSAVVYTRSGNRYIFRRYLLRAGLSFTLALLLLPVCGETEHVLFYSDPPSLSFQQGGLINFEKRRRVS